MMHDDVCDDVLSPDDAFMNVGCQLFVSFVRAVRYVSGKYTRTSSARSLSWVSRFGCFMRFAFVISFPGTVNDFVWLSVHRAL